MNKIKLLIKNMGLFALANVGSKMLALVMVPIYSYVLTTSEFGITDIYMTTMNLLVPVVSCSIFDAVFRFSMGTSEDKRVHYFNSGLSFSIIVFIGLLFGGVVLSNMLPVSKSDLILLTVLIGLQIFVSLFQQYARAIDKVLVFSISGLIYTLTYLLTNILLLVVFRFGVTGYLASYVFACLTTLSYLIVAIFLPQIKIYGYRFTLSSMSEMLSYCVPLIPNAILWWIITASDRYVILLFYGLDSAGLYAAANKIPILLSVFTGIFFQAWQISAINETSEANNGFSKMIINGLISVCLVISSLVLIIAKPAVSLLLDKNYGEVWIYIPFLLLGVVFQCLSSFYGTVYIAFKKTKSVMITSAIGAAVNLAGNFILVPIFGVQAACFTTCISFMTMWIIRMIDTKRIYFIPPNYRLLIPAGIALIAQTICFLTFEKTWMQVALTTTIIVVVCYANRHIIASTFKKLERNKR